MRGPIDRASRFSALWSGRSAAWSRLLIFLIAGCNAPVQEAAQTGEQVYLIGTEPDVGGSDNRYEVTIDRRFLLGDRQRSETAIPTSQVTFAVRYPDLSPLPQDRLADPRAIIVSIGWEPPGSIKRRWDGSWSNYYSIYNKPLPDRFGLAVEQRGGNPADQSIILHSKPSQREVLIECWETTGGGRTGCRMRHRIKGHVVGQAAFSWDLLPDWQNIRTSSSRLFQIQPREGKNQ